jgi:N-acetylglucosaminyl-diphospho-decaprenol L-rhamnosyltransferase
VRPAVSAIIVSYGTADRLPSLLARLRASGAVLETIVVDSASPDAERAREAGADRFIGLTTNLGFGAAANAAARDARGEILAFVNPDVKPAATTLDELVRALEGFAATGPRLVGTDGRHQMGDCGEEPSVGRALLYALGGGGIFHRRARGRVGWITGAFLVVRREAFLAVGGFDESFFLFGEDVDLGRRLRAAGHELRYAPETVVEHEGRSSYAGTELEGQWTLGLRRAHAKGGAGALARGVFASLLALGLVERALLSSRDKRRLLLRAARFALSRSGPGRAGDSKDPRAAS